MNVTDPRSTILQVLPIRPLHRPDRLFHAPSRRIAQRRSYPVLFSVTSVTHGMTQKRALRADVAKNRERRLGARVLSPATLRAAQLAIGPTIDDSVRRSDGSMRAAPRSAPHTKAKIAPYTDHTGELSGTSYPAGYPAGLSAGLSGRLSTLLSWPAGSDQDVVEDISTRLHSPTVHTGRAWGSEEAGSEHVDSYPTGYPVDSYPELSRAIR